MHARMSMKTAYLSKYMVHWNIKVAHALPAVDIHC